MHLIAPVFLKQLMGRVQQNKFGVPFILNVFVSKIRLVPLWLEHGTNKHRQREQSVAAEKQSFAAENKKNCVTHFLARFCRFVTHLGFALASVGSSQLKKTEAPQKKRLKKKNKRM